MKKLKCINDDFTKVKEEILRESKGLPITFPVKGKTYTVREVFENDGLVTSFLLQEIYNPTFYIPVIQQRRELSFAEWRFEQLHDDISEVATKKETEVIFNQQT